MPIDREKMRELTDRIQVGDTDEGADALQEIVELVRTEERADVRQVLDDELINRRLKADNDAALQRFEDKYPELKGNSRRNRLLVDATKTALREEIVNDLKGAGVDEKNIAPIANDTGGLVAVHSQARARGLKLRGPDEVLQSVGKTLVEDFNIKPASTGRTGAEYIADLRKERGFKRQDEMPGGSRAPASSRLAAEQQDRTRSAVQQMRESRGFAPRTLR